MKNKIVGWIIGLVVLLLIILGLFWIFNASKPSTAEVQKNAAEVNIKELGLLNDKDLNKKITSDIEKIKGLDKYKTVKPSFWTQTKETLLKSPREDKISSFDWIIAGALDTYQEDLKVNLISYKELKEKLKNKESMVVMYSQPRCPHCINLKTDGFDQYYKNLAKNGKKVYMVNAAIEQDIWTDKTLWDKSKDVSENKTNSNNISVPGTPALAYYSNGKISQGFVSEKFSSVKNWMSKLDVVK